MSISCLFIPLGCNVSNGKDKDPNSIQIVPPESKAKTKSKPKSKKKEEDLLESNMPGGRFWITIKNPGAQTLYKCPFDDCEKSNSKFSCIPITFGLAFTRPYNLKSHYRSHTGEKPFVCDFQGCGLKFSRKYDLSRHQKLHS